MSKTSNRLSDVLRLHSEGLTNKQIAEATGYTRHFVCTYLRKNGLTFNGPGKTKVEVVDGMVACNRCGTVKPATPEYFRFTGKYIRGECRECRNAGRKQYRNRDIFRYRVISLRASCKARGIPFNLTVEYLRSVYERQRGLCFYTDAPLTTALVPKEERKAGALSVDRIYPDAGYVPGNVVLCTYKANTVKNDLTMPEIAAWLPGWYERIMKLTMEELAAA